MRSVRWALYLQRLTESMVVAPKWVNRPRVWLVLAACAAMFLLGIANFFTPVIRLSSPLANHVTFLAILLLPWVVVALASLVRPVWLAVAVGTLGVATGIASGVLAILVAFSTYSTWTDGRDQSFLSVSEVRTDAGVVRAYETNGGATTDYGLVVRQERAIFPGVLLVKNVYDEYHARGGRVEMVGPDRVLVHPQRDGVLAEGTEIRVRKLVWF
jgi:hypothetical protein